MKKFFKKKLYKLSELSHVNNNKFSSIYYHDVKEHTGNSFDSISLEKFKSQIITLKKLGYQSLTFDELENIDPSSLKSKKYIIITFDDGYRSNYDLVFPLLINQNIKFNVFLEVKKINNNDNYMSWDMIKEMYQSQMVGFGAHTYNHVDMRFDTYNRLKNEIYEPNEIIKENTGILVKDFCYPYGAYSKRSNIILNRTQQFQRFYTSDGIYTKKYSHSYLIGRIGIENEDTQRDFLKKIDGSFNNYFKFIRLIKNILGVNRSEIRRVES